MVICFAGIALLIFQVFQWHVHGMWPNINLLWALSLIPYGGLQNWVINPTYWDGLHDFLASVPVWALLFFLGLASMIKNVTK